MSSDKKSISVDRNREFYQAKFDYYRLMNTCVVIVTCLSSITYYFSDIYLIGHWDLATLPARLFILIPFVIFLIVNKKVRDYRVMVPITYLMAHIIMWCTIWACTKLPTLTFASDGFIIICAIFIVFGIAAPFKWAIVLHGLIFVDILVADTFLHYPELDMMLMLGIPFYLGISVFIWGIEKVFVDQYIIKSKLEDNAIHDQLTGIYNRNIIQKLTKMDNSFSNFYKEDLCMILLDIDYFKKVNDTYGHESGDIVLKEIVELIQKKLRKTDYFIRWGGEEFVIIIEAPLDVSMKKAEEIREYIEKNTNKICPVTISAGVSRYRGGDYRDTVKRADEALYGAKNSGRNKVCCGELMMTKKDND